MVISIDLQTDLLMDLSIDLLNGLLTDLRIDLSMDLLPGVQTDLLMAHWKEILMDLVMVRTHHGQPLVATKTGGMLVDWGLDMNGERRTGTGLQTSSGMIGALRRSHDRHGMT
jgi:hypothetical protein